MSPQFQSYAGQRTGSTASSSASEAFSRCESSDKATGPARILAVDDNSINLEVLREQMRVLGHAADCVECGADALVKWMASDYLLLFVDCQMPGMDGFELSRQIRQHEHRSGKRVPITIIGWTGNAMEEHASNCIAAGMNDVMIKPVTLQSLSEKLARWLPPAASR